ncbi:hypothetical protein EVAR_38114_1 [Eumeta japonica]|uniref:Uncharacterized protein n=1 Tax=Eumeta variegata TaxID=151549 RepID=A0A4C1X670_EUMVA|nr:hypothetical protein EVAR_38114_1 [Eumeta japonica]
MKTPLPVWERGTISFSVTNITIISVVTAVSSSLIYTGPAQGLRAKAGVSEIKRLWETVTRQFKRNRCRRRGGAGRGGTGDFDAGPKANICMEFGATAARPRREP